MIAGQGGWPAYLTAHQLYAGPYFVMASYQTYTMHMLADWGRWLAGWLAG